MLFPIIGAETELEKVFGKTRVQTTTRPSNVSTHIWKTLSNKQRKDAQDYWAQVLAARDRRRLATLQCWTRADYQAVVLRTTTSDGPKWNTVHRRVVTDAHTGQVLVDQDVRGVTNKGILYAKVPGGPRDIVTKLYHNDSNLPDGVVRQEVAAGEPAAPAYTVIHPLTNAYSCFTRPVSEVLEPPRQAHRPFVFAVPATASVTRAQNDEDSIPVPAMPILPASCSVQPHREKLDEVSPYDVGCCLVARQLPKKEVLALSLIHI